MAPLTVSFVRTPGAATLRMVLIVALNASATATGAAKTVMVAVAVELPAKLLTVYLKVSVPVKPAGGL